MKNFLFLILFCTLATGLVAQEQLPNKTDIQLGVNVGYSFDGADLDLGAVVFFDDVGLTAGYILDLGDDDVLDYGFRVGVGKKFSEKYLGFANIVALKTPDSNNLSTDLDISYGVDIGYSFTDYLALTIGAETTRGVRLGIIAKM